MATYIKHNAFWIFVLILVSYLFLAGVCIEDSMGNNNVQIDKQRIRQYITISKNARAIAFETMPEMAEMKQHFIEFNQLKEEYLSLIKNQDTLNKPQNN